MSLVDRVKKSPKIKDGKESFLNYVAINSKHKAEFEGLKFSISYDPMLGSNGEFKVKIVNADAEDTRIAALQEFFECYYSCLPEQDGSGVKFGWSSTNMIHPRLALVDEEGNYIGTAW